jgi:hypothetical protein
MATVISRKGKTGQISFLVRARVKSHPPQSQTFRRKMDAAK